MSEKFENGSRFFIWRWDTFVCITFIFLFRSIFDEDINKSLLREEK